MKSFAVCALLGSGCVVTSAASEGPRPAQEHCPFESAPMQTAKTECPPEVLDLFVQAVSERGHKNWDPQRLVSDPNSYVDRYGGKALMTVVGVSVDPTGGIAELGVAKSSGDDTLDHLAVEALRKGGALLYPPACALTDGEFRFRVGLCLEVEQGRTWSGPRIRFAWPSGESSNDTPR
jgi:TonB family protein